MKRSFGMQAAIGVTLFGAGAVTAAFGAVAGGPGNTTTSAFHHPGQTTATATTTTAMTTSAATTTYPTHTPTAGTVWLATLSSAQEIPRQVVADTKAHGSFTGKLTGSKLKYTLTFAGLTGPATMAHIHLGAVGKSGNVVIPLCMPCKSPMSATVTVTAAVKREFAEHLLYVNVHTAKNPNGEIRGQLSG